MYFHLICSSLGPHNSIRKRQFIRFCKTHQRAQYTDRESDHGMCDICSNSSHAELIAVLVMPAKKTQIHPPTGPIVPLGLLKWSIKLPISVWHILLNANTNRKFQKQQTIPICCRNVMGKMCHAVSSSTNH